MGNKIQTNKQYSGIYTNLVLKSSKYLNLSNDTQGVSAKTRHFLNKEFLSHLYVIGKQRKEFQRSQNPFCPFVMKESQNWMTCCFISPLMVLASPVYLLDNEGFYVHPCQIHAVSRRQVNILSIKTAIEIQQNKLCLLVLQKPFWKVGWMNISYLTSPLELNSQKIKIVNHPQKVYKKQKGCMIHMQEIKQICLPQITVYKQRYYSKNKNFTGSLIVSTKSQVPTLLGMQVSQNQCLIFNEKTYNKIQKESKKYIEKNYKQIISQMIKNKNEIILQSQTSPNQLIKV